VSKRHKRDRRDKLKRKAKQKRVAQTPRLGPEFYSGKTDVISVQTSLPMVGTTRSFSEQVSAKIEYTAAKSSSGKYKACSESHPPLDLGNGLSIHGGSASSPMVKDADIYVSLDYGKNADRRAYPWNGGQFIYFPITDMNAPSDAVEFKKLITWLAEQIKAGHKVHVGCIGGHGRTGTLFAALVKEMTGNVNAIQYVRDGYCKKAVESEAQVDFLVTHYGLARVKGAKNYGYEVYPSNGGSKKSFYDKYPEYRYNREGDDTSSDAAVKSRVSVAKAKENNKAVVDPGQLEGNIWGLTDADDASLDFTNEVEVD
jgi:hypothetical protein